MKSLNIKLIMSIMALICIMNLISTKANLKKVTLERQDTPAVPAAPVAEPAQPPVVAANMTEVFAGLFEDPTRLNVACPCKKTREELEALKVNITAEGAVWSAPRRKENLHEKKKMGWEGSAYLFDFLDDVLQKEIVNEFNRIFTDAQKLQGHKDYKEPYGLEKLLGMNTAMDLPSKDELVKKISAVAPHFNIQIWEKSISCAQMNIIIKEWNWHSEPALPDAGKYIVDKYDYDGDGRLNAREFVIAMIRNNKKVLEGPKRCKNCLENVVQNKIDPIFMYLDCSNTNSITSEQIWIGLQRLKRSTKGYDFFKCELENGRYRTSSINDFVLKAHKLVNGKVTKDEFRMGVLQGFWDRQTDLTKIYLDDAKNMKNLRWSQNGLVDTICEKIKNSIELNRGY